MDTLSNRRNIFVIVCHVLTVIVSFKFCLANKIPATFVFGDSLVDAGNNNYIQSLSRANYIPNGIDLGGPTGRFTNGRTAVDIICQELGFKNFPPPYLAPTTKGPVILQGVNYASGAGGILNKTGEVFGGRINLDAQIDNFENTRRDIISSIGASAAMELFQSSMFTITIGSNDFINNYLTPILSIPEQQLVSPELFVVTMITRFRQQLNRLYSLGARKIVVTNIGPIGCIPYMRDTNPDAGETCVSSANHMVQLYNSALRSLLDELRTSLNGSVLVYADTYHMVDEIAQNYQSYGFENANSACCTLGGRHGGLIPCGPSSKVCPDRSKYVFWDAYHPSDAANTILAKRLMDGNTDDISPMNVRQLSQL